MIKLIRYPSWIIQKKIFTKIVVNNLIPRYVKWNITSSMIMKKVANIKYFFRDDKRHLNNLLIILKKEGKNQRRKSKKYDWIRIETDNHIPRTIFKYLIKFFIVKKKKNYAYINNLKHILHTSYIRIQKQKFYVPFFLPSIAQNN